MAEIRIGGELYFNQPPVAETRYSDAGSKRVWSKMIHE